MAFKIFVICSFFATKIGLNRNIGRGTSLNINLISCTICFHPRDENGFKCHTMSEAHQRQLLIFAETPDKFLDTYSKEFQDGFMTCLRRTYGTKRVYANQVWKYKCTKQNNLLIYYNIGDKISFPFIPHCNYGMDVLC